MENERCKSTVYGCESEPNSVVIVNVIVDLLEQLFRTPTATIGDSLAGGGRAAMVSKCSTTMTIEPARLISMRGVAHYIWAMSTSELEGDSSKDA